MLKIRKIFPNAILPTCEMKQGVYDLFAFDMTTISMCGSSTISIGIELYMPDGYIGLIQSNNSNNITGFSVESRVLTTDGELKLHIKNNKFDENITIHRQQKLAHLILLPCTMLEISEITN